MTLDQIRAIFGQHGAQPYSGEPVTQLEHALQTAALAESSDAVDALIAAALLHDLGHMMNQPDKHDPKAIDDLHQFRALPLLRQEFPDAVTEPIRLHVDAKRYMCATDTRYLATLSPVSTNSLRLQGGPFSAEEARRFEQLPFAAAAVQLRRWDDAAKVPGCRTPALDHFMEKVQRVMAHRS